ncbi:MAG: TlyA family RNA methyltransferase [Promethearchaeota archaeon]
MKQRIDILLVKRRLVESRAQAKWLIKNGYILVNKKQILKPSKRIDNLLEIQLTKQFPYVGRGGLKLEVALKEFFISVKGKICADIGASIGGFTDCLIKHGASRVYAIDTATDLLHPSLISEEMKEIVIPMLGVDARNFLPIGERLDICTIDVTFASLKSILPNLKRILKKNSDIIALVKPIFETEIDPHKKLYAIQDPNQLYQILNGLIQWFIKNQFFLVKVIKSPKVGREGATEFLVHLKLKKNIVKIDYNQMISNILK